MELASCHPSGAKYFEIAPKFVEILCIPSLDYVSDCDIYGNTLLHVGN
jgi:hypothetical protein